MTRRKRKSVGGSYTQKPDDLRDRGPSGPVVVRYLTPEETAARIKGRNARHAE